MKTLPLGTAYTVWTGIGAIGAFVGGVVMLGEPLTIERALAAALIVTGLSAMKLTASAFNASNGRPWRCLQMCFGGLVQGLLTRFERTGGAVIADYVVTP